MNRTILRKILSDAKVKRAVEKGDTTKAVVAAMAVLIKNKPSDYALVDRLLKERKQAAGVFLPTPIKPGSSMEEALIDYTNDLQNMYLDMAERYVTEMDARFPLDREEVYAFAILEGVKKIKRGNVWTVNNLRSSATWEIVTVRLSELYYAHADRSPELTTHLVKQIRTQLLYTDEIMSHTGRKARIIRFIKLMSESFNVEVSDTEQMKKLLNLAVSVAKAALLKMYDGAFTKDTQHARLGWVCGTDLQEGNSAIKRIKDAIKEHQDAKNRKPVRQSSDNFDL